MDIDFNTQLNSAERTVRALTRDGKPARSITIARTFSVTAEDLWGAVTTADRIGRWFTPVSGDLKLGGQFQLQDNASGEVKACERPSKLSLTWVFGEDTSWVDIAIAPSGGSARLSLTHTALVTAHWEEYGAGAGGIGWELGFLGLAHHLAHPAAPRPDAEAFFGHPDTKRFIQQSGELWSQASIRARVDAVAAPAAARRTIAFYTGVPPEQA